MKTILILSVLVPLLQAGRFVAIKKWPRRHEDANEKFGIMQKHERSLGLFPEQKIVEGCKDLE